MIGRRAIDDPRNGLVRDFVRLVRELDASAFVFENVKGLTVGNHRRFLQELVSAFEAAGYAVLTPYRVLNAKDYGVPQSRERLFLMGVKRGERLPAYPVPLRFGVTCKDALGDLPEAELYGDLWHGDTARGVSWGSPSAYASDMRCLSNAAWHHGHVRDWDRAVLTCSMRTEHTAISRRRFAETTPGTVEPISRLFKLAPDGISNTLRAGTDAARGAFTSPRPIHYDRHRCITVREMARLHGFPDWFRFHQTKWHGARQIGNAVPPPLARAVAFSVMQALGRVPSRPAGSIALGDPALLLMDMGQAAAFWQVERPAGKRDRKSGDVKRKQADIEALRLAALAAE
jgi:DNA (cytosine-5)-methyltransferase 1